MAQSGSDEFGDVLRHGHRGVFERFADALQAPVNGGADANPGQITDEAIDWRIQLHAGAGGRGYHLQMILSIS
jgi:hypothetical protein